MNIIINSFLFLAILLIPMSEGKKQKRPFDIKPVTKEYFMGKVEHYADKIRSYVSYTTGEFCDKEKVIQEINEKVRAMSDFYDSVDLPGKRKQEEPILNEGFTAYHDAVEDYYILCTGDAKE